MRTLKHRCEPSAARDGLLRFAQPMATLRSPSPQRPSGSTSWIFWEHSDEMTGNILARQWHPRLGTSTDCERALNTPHLWASKFPQFCRGVSPPGLLTGRAGDAVVADAGPLGGGEQHGGQS